MSLPFSLNACERLASREIASAKTRMHTFYHAGHYGWLTWLAKNNGVVQAAGQKRYRALLAHGFIICLVMYQAKLQKEENAYVQTRHFAHGSS